MISKLSVLLTILLFSSFAYGQDSLCSQKIVLGKTEILLHSTFYNPCSNAISFINLHDNENSSVEAAELFLQEFGGSVMQLKHAGERNISFVVNKRKYTFDPNRIFTPVGIKNTLNNLGAYHKKPAEIISGFASEIIKKYVKDKKLIVALHNNSDSNYSILSYLPGGSEAPNALRVYINPEMDSDDFIYTTNSTIFDTLQARMINVILQDNERLIDDGSLSVYASRLNIPYVNVEAQEGHLQQQLVLILALKDILEWYK